MKSVYIIIIQLREQKPNAEYIVILKYLSELYQYFAMWSC